MSTGAIQWKKLGRIFDPIQHPLPAGCIDYAQSPQALLGDGFVRIYFSTRSRDSVSNKFLSQVAFVDFDPSFQQVLQVSREPVLALGQLGCFDEHGIFPFSPVRVGSQVFAYTCGWSRRVAVSVETGIGLVISDDQGETFQRLGDGPLLSATLHEPCLVGDAFVRRFGNQFHMWYIFGKPWRYYAGRPEPDRIYKIAQATSPDGIHWLKTGAEQLIADAIGSDECQALPTVIEHAGRFHMYFCFRHADDFRQNPERAYRLGYASSSDLVHWTRNDQLVGIERAADSEQWDSQMMCYPHVFRVDQKTYLLYNGNEFGRCGFGLAVADTSSMEQPTHDREIRYETSTAKCMAIRVHLQSCSGQFLPPLEERVDLDQYASKLSRLSITFEAWHENQLIGLVAAYFDTANQSRTAFVSNVSVVPEFQIQGIGKKLMERCHREALRRGFEYVTLEVSLVNVTVIDWYARIGYSTLSIGETTRMMSYQLDPIA